MKELWLPFMFPVLHFPQWCLNLMKGCGLLCNNNRSNNFELRFDDMVVKTLSGDRNATVTQR